MHPINLLVVLLASLFSFLACAQDQVEQCAVNCVSNINGTGCVASDWPCLCNSTLYIDRLNACTYQVCNTTQGQQATFGAIAEICVIFNEPLTASPEATIPAATLSSAITSGVSIVIPTSISSEPVGPGTTNAGSVTPTSASTSLANSQGMSTQSPTASPSPGTGTISPGSGPSSTSATPAQFSGGVGSLSGSTVLHIAGLIIGLAASGLF